MGHCPLERRRTERSRAALIGFPAISALEIYREGVCNVDQRGRQSRKGLFYSGESPRECPKGAKKPRGEERRGGGRGREATYVASMNLKREIFLRTQTC